MRPIKEWEYANLLGVFERENAEKDQRVKTQLGHVDQWPRDRFQEANARFKGEWHEYEFEQADLARIRLHLNTDFDIPKEGMMLRDALKQPKVETWIRDGQFERFPHGTHLWLGSSYYNNGGPEYKDMKDHDGCFILLDGIHRCLDWARLGLPSVLVFMAGSPERIELA